MLTKLVLVVAQVICKLLCGDFKRSRNWSDGTSQRGESFLQEAPARSELLYLWDSLCGKLEFALEELFVGL